MPLQMQKRTRGYILTRQGAEKLEAAKREWESQHGAGCTEEKMRELTSPFKENGLDPGTIRKIFKGEERVDKKSIRCLFSVFNLQLDDDDLTSELQACLPKLDPNFLGRDEAIADLNNLVRQGAKVILIQAEGGIGKTTLAEQYFKIQSFDLVLELYMTKETENIKPVEGRIEQWLRKFKDEPGRDFDTTLDKLREHLWDDSRRIGVLIDNLEPALKNGLFRDTSWRYADLLRMLASVRSVTLITSREPLYEPGIRADLYQLKELKEEDWKQYFDRHDIKTSSPALGEMHHAYGGNAEAMYIFKGAIRHECKGDLEAYWQRNSKDLLRYPTLENLVQGQFEKLRQDNPQAYKLLYRSSCYRYQDIPRVPKEGLFGLLWDVPEERHRLRIVDALQSRSLVKVRDEGYYLHPLIQAEARERLHSIGEWEAANYNAALFWIQVLGQDETLEVHAKKVFTFECLYHCLKGKNLELSEAIKLSDNLSNSCNMMKAAYELADSCYHIGLGYHQLAINFYLGRKPKESQEKFQESREKFQEAILRFSQLEALKLAEKVKQALDSMNISEACCSTAEPRF